MRTLAWSCLTIAATAAPAQEVAERTLRPASEPGGRAAGGPLDWVLEKVASGRDEGSVEKVHDELNLLLGGFTARIVERSAAGGLQAGDVSPYLAADFRCASLTCGEPVRRELGGGLRVERCEAAPAAALEDLPAMDPAGLAAGLGALLSGCERLEKAKIKVFRIEPSPPPSRRIATRVLLEADGLGGEGGRPAGRFQVRAVWDLDWEPRESSWLLAALRPVSVERARLPRRVFTEATAAAFGHNASYREQLLTGVDEWRLRLDAATGIDIYGHQGISVGDFDGDGWEDLLVAQCAGLPNRLYRNRGDGTFDDVTDASGVGVLDATGGTLFADLDGDGDLDLVTVTALETLLFENRGDRTFRRVEPCGLEASGGAGASSMGAAAADYDRDGDLDLYIFCYVFWAGAGSKTHSSYPYPYHDANNGAPNFLFRNRGGLRFEDVTVPSGLGVNNRRFSLAASWCDYDQDGDPDLYVANDFGRNNFYLNEGDGTFRDVSAAAGVEDTGNGMSVTWEDYDGDARIDLYVGNMWSSAGSRIAEQPSFGMADAGLRSIYRRMARGSSLFRNRGDGTFADVSIESGAYFGRWAWSSQFIDHDADGREDLYVSNGFVTGESSDDL